MIEFDQSKAFQRWNNRITSRLRQFLAWEHAAILFLITSMLIVGAVLVTDYGRSADEYLHRTYAKQVIEVYAGLRHPTDAITNLEYYGPAYNLASHALSAVFSWTGFLADRAAGWHFSYFLTFVLACWSVYGISRRLMSKAAATTTMLLLFMQPLYFGHAFINPKDIPFMGFFSATIFLGFLLIESQRNQSDSSATKSPEKYSNRLIPMISSTWQESRIRLRLIFLGAILALVALILGYISGFWLRLSEDLLIYLYSESVWRPLRQLLELVAEDASKTAPSAYIRKIRLLLPWLSTSTGFALSLAALASGLRIYGDGSIPEQLKRHQKWILLLCTAILFGLATSIRIGGLFAGVLVSILLLGEFRGKAILQLTTLWGIGLAVSYATWPFLWGDPIGRTLTVLRQMTNFPWQGTQLYEGQLYHAYELPRSFLPRMLSFQLTEPILLLVVVGTMVLVYRLFGRDKDQKAWQIAVVSIWFLGPFIFSIVFKTPIYGNFRQLLFITPPLFIVSGLGLDKAFSALQRPILCYLLAGLVILPGVLSIVRLHPYQYIYYNEIVGGVSGASGRFPLDGCTSSREAMEFVNRTAEPNARIGYDRSFHLVLPYSRDDLELVHVGSTEEAVAKDVDYIYSCSGTGFQELPTAYEVVIDGTALSVVREGPAGD
jgi:hypothetical protein